MGVSIIPSALYNALIGSGISIATNVTLAQLAKLIDTNEKIKSFMSKKIDSVFINDMARRLGIEVNKDEGLLYGSIIKSMISSGINVGTMGVSNYVISTTASYGIGKVKSLLGRGKGKGKKRDVKDVENMSDKKFKSMMDESLSSIQDNVRGIIEDVATAIVDPDVNMDDVAQVVDDNIRRLPRTRGVKRGESIKDTGKGIASISKRLATTRLASKRSRDNKINDLRILSEKEFEIETPIQNIEIPMNVDVNVKIPIPKVIDKSYLNMMKDNRSVLLSTSIGLSLMTLAMTSDVTQISTILTDVFGDVINNGNVLTENLIPSISNAISSTTDFLAEQRLIKNMVFGMIGKSVGIDRFINNLTPFLKDKDLDDIKKMRVGNVDDIGMISKIFDRVTGNKIYARTELNDMNLSQLKELVSNTKYVNEKISIPSNVLRKDVGKYKKIMIDALMKEQQLRCATIYNMLTSTIKMSITASVSRGVLEYGFTNLQQFDLAQAYKTMTAEQLDVELEKNMNDKDFVLEEGEVIDEEGVKRERRSEAKKLQKMMTSAIKRNISRRDVQTKNIAERRTTQRILRDSIRNEQISRDAHTIAVDGNGLLHAIPDDNELLRQVGINERTREALNIEFTPLLDYMSRQIIQSQASWIPGVGWVSNLVQSVNLGLDVLETGKNVANILTSMLEVDLGTGGRTINVDIEGAGMQEITGMNVGELLSQRLPSLNDIINNYVSTDTVNLKVLIIEVLKERLVNGWSDQRTTYEIGKRVMGEQYISVSENLLSQLGSYFL